MACILKARALLRADPSEISGCSLVQMIPLGVILLALPTLA